MNASIKAPARAALYTAGSTLVTCAHHAERIGLRVVTMIEGNCPDVGLAGTRLNGLIDRLDDGEFEVIVADAGSGRIVTIAAVPDDKVPVNDYPWDKGGAAPVIEPNLRCAIYMRCATVEGPDPLAAQFEACQVYAAKQGWKSVAVFSDAGVSGRDASRVGLDDMMDQARAAAFDVLLVEDLDRLGRDTSHVVRVLKELGAMGIAVHTVIGDTLNQLELRIRSGLSQSLREAKSLQAKHGHREAKRRKAAS